ncbi:Dimethylglycine dehydrogenase, mitochondrial [Lamellibrachia satsuma]|nr:Dimethylglycine dehydrogenase, mitochondrial [Lamellibrachia satsuma]
MICLSPQAADFVGKTALQRILREKPKRHLVYLTVNTSNVDPEGNETVWYNDKVVGNTTSGAYGYSVQESVAFAYVPAELSSPGQQLQVELLGNRCPATILKQAPIKIEAMRNRPKRKTKMPENSV